jgi:hypothetical protein
MTSFKVRDKAPSDPERRAARQAWLNVNAFEAKLSTKEIELLDNRKIAGRVLRNALEYTPWELHHYPHIDDPPFMDPDDYPAWREHELELISIRSLDACVPAAAVWIKINGKGIYDMEGKMGDEYEPSRDPEPRSWNGPLGWSKARFHHWMERFEWISTVAALEIQTREDAKEAAEIMRKIEEVNK